MQLPLLPTFFFFETTLTMSGVETRSGSTSYWANGVLVDDAGKGTPAAVLSSETFRGLGATSGTVDDGATAFSGISPPLSTTNEAGDRLRGVLGRFSDESVVDFDSFPIFSGRVNVRRK